MKRRAKRASRNCYGDEHVAQLMHGHDFYNAAFNRDLGIYVMPRLGDPNAPPELREACAAAWPVLREQVFEQWKQQPWNLCKRPIGWWLFESPEPRDESISEREQLNALQLLPLAEKAAYEKYEAEMADPADEPDDLSVMDVFQTPETER